MTLRFTLSDVAKGFVDTIVREMQRPIAKAATAAIGEAGDIAKRPRQHRCRRLLPEMAERVARQFLPPAGRQHAPGGVHL